MPKHRIPMDEWVSGVNRAMEKYVPLESERPIKFIHASQCVFVETEYRPGHEPEPELVEEPAPVEEPIPEEEVVVPDDTWTKKKLIKHAKKLDIYDPEMEKRSYTKAMIIDAITSL